MQIKPLIQTALVVVVVMAIVNRIDPVKKIISG